MLADIDDIDSKDHWPITLLNTEILGSTLLAKKRIRWILLTYLTKGNNKNIYIIQ